VIQAAFSSLQSLLKQIAVLAEVVEQAGQVSIIPCLKGRREPARAFGNLSQMISQGIPLAVIVCAVCEVNGPR
jgi:hypothetical protein